MAATSADSSIPPPLRALGGWLDAEWFPSSILSETEVVGISLPKLPGTRKQNFQLAERSAAEAAPRETRKPADPGLPARIATSMGEVLDDAGATRACAFRRTTFFFEAAPSLYFAEIPLAKLKIRAADTLRRELLRTEARGCVLRLQAGLATAMFWPCTELEITAFIRAADAPYALHSQFDQAEEARRLDSRPGGGFLKGRRAADPPGAKRAARPSGSAAQDRSERLHCVERDRLLKELDGLRTRIVELQRSQSAVGAMEVLGLDEARLKAMLRLLHPDRHGNSEAANEAAKWVNGLRDVLKAGKRSDI